MTKIKYIGISNSMNSNGKQYFKDTVYEVSDEVAEYFKKNFSSSFEIVNAKPAPVKEEVKVEEPVKEEEVVVEKVVKKPTRKSTKKAPKE